MHFSISSFLILHFGLNMASVGVLAQTDSDRELAGQMDAQQCINHCVADSECSVVRLSSRIPCLCDIMNGHACLRAQVCRTFGITDHLNRMMTSVCINSEKIWVPLDPPKSTTTTRRNQDTPIATSGPVWGKDNGKDDPDEAAEKEAERLQAEKENSATNTPPASTPTDLGADKLRDTENKDLGSTGLHPGATAGIVVGALVVIGLALVVFLQRRKLQRAKGMGIMAPLYASDDNNWGGKMELDDTRYVPVVVNHELDGTGYYAPKKPLQNHELEGISSATANKPKDMNMEEDTLYSPPIYAIGPVQELEGSERLLRGDTVVAHRPKSTRTLVSELDERRGSPKLR